jgi:Tol biopolymer transport system component
MPETTDKVFISYSRKDEAFARKLAIWLNQALDMGVWLDVDDIPVGIKWSAAIQDGLDNCEVMVVVMSPDAMKSVNVEDEWQYFLDQNKPVVPILLKSAPIPYQLRRIQYIDFSVRDEYAESQRKLLTELRRHLNPTPSEELSILRAEGSKRIEIDGIKKTPSKQAKKHQAQLKQSEKILKKSSRALVVSNIINAILAVLILGVIGVVIGIFFFLRTAPEGISIRVEGNHILVTTDGVTRPLEEFPNGEVAIGSEINTGVEPATIVNANGSEVVLGPGSSATVNETDADSLDVALANGTVSIDPEGIQTVIRTLNDVSANSRVSRLDVQVDDSSDTLRVDCPDGGCSVSNTDGSNTIELEANDSVTVTGGDVAKAVVASIPGEIAFTSYQHGAPEIYLMDTTGTNLTRLTNNGTQDLDPAWSPNGTRIVYQTFNVTDGNWDIATVNANGGEPTILTPDSSAHDTEPAWSPDGTKIAFVSEREGNEDIYVMDRDGANIQRLTDDAAPDTSPTWSADGTRIAFVSTRTGNDEIFVLTLGSDELPVNLTQNPANDNNPAWSPDGTKIAFDSLRDSSAREVYVMNADGSEVINLSNDGAIDIEPTWSPDSLQVVFVSQRSGNNKIFVVPSDGSAEPTNLSGQISYEQSEPAWLPQFRAGA